MNDAQLRLLLAAILLVPEADCLDESSPARGLARADALLAAAQPKVETSPLIRERHHDDGSYVVYPCPQCGEAEYDLNAKFASDVRKIATEYGWDGLCPLTDWLGDSLLDNKIGELTALRAWKEGMLSEHRKMVEHSADLQAQVDRQFSKLSRNAEQLDALRAENARLREALEAINSNIIELSNQKPRMHGWVPLVAIEDCIASWGSIARAALEDTK